MIKIIQTLSSWAIAIGPRKPNSISFHLYSASAAQGGHATRRDNSGIKLNDHMSCIKTNIIRNVTSTRDINSLFMTCLLKILKGKMGK